MSRSANTAEVNMLPFLGVLCAVIGILMLLLVATLTTRVVGSAAAAAGAKAAGEAAPGLDPELHAALRRQIEGLKAEADLRRNELQEARGAVALIEDVVRIRQDAAALGLSGPDDLYPGIALGQPTEVQAVPDPTRKDRRRPVPVEIADRGCVVHAPGKTVTLDDVRRDDAALRPFLEEMVRRRDEQYLLLLVHPNGVETYRWFREHLEQRFSVPAKFGGQTVRKIAFDLGVEPFDRQWLLVPTE